MIGVPGVAQNYDEQTPDQDKTCQTSLCWLTCKAIINRFSFALSKHDHKQEGDDNGTCINNHGSSSEESSTGEQKKTGGGEHHHGEPECRMHRIACCDHQGRGGHAGDCEDIEENFGDDRGRGTTQHHELTGGEQDQSKADCKDQAGLGELTPVRHHQISAHTA